MIPARPTAGSLNPVLVREIADALGTLPIGGFLVLQYVAAGEAGEPFAQALREPAGWYLELVSEYYISADAWPIRPLWLVPAGWRAPAPLSAENWSHSAVERSSAAERLVASLVHGRSCRDSEGFRWYDVHPPYPDGGEPVLDTWVPARRAA